MVVQSTNEQGEKENQASLDLSPKGDDLNQGIHREVVFW